VVSGQWSVFRFLKQVFRSKPSVFSRPLTADLIAAGRVDSGSVPCSLFPAYKAFISRLLHSYARWILLELRCCLAEARLPIARPARRKAGKDASDGRHV